MKKCILGVIVFIIILTPAVVSAQNEYGLVKVDGQAEIAMPPDEAVVRFALENIELDYALAVSSIGHKADELVKSLKKLGYSEERIKTRDLNISVNIIYRQNQRIDSGYIGRQNLELVLAYNHKEIIKIINGVSGSDANPGLSFAFRLSEEHLKAIKDELLSQAVLDARHKAEILCEASGSEITGIEEINYGNLNFPGPQMMRMAEFDSGAEPDFGGFHVSDIQQSESVHVIYRISNIK